MGMNDLLRRRRAMMEKKADIIGYRLNYGFTGASRNVSIGTVNGRFLTGFIPINGAKRVACYYGGNISSGSKHYMVEYNGDKIYTNKDGFWDMTVKNQRTVTLYTSDVQYVRFSGFMDVIEQCYVKNADTGEILWEKGM